MELLKHRWFNIRYAHQKALYQYDGSIDLTTTDRSVFAHLCRKSAVSILSYRITSSGHSSSSHLSLDSLHQRECCCGRNSVGSSMSSSLPSASDVQEEQLTPIVSGDVSNGSEFPGITSSVLFPSTHLYRNETCNLCKIPSSSPTTNHASAVDPLDVSFGNNNASTEGKLLSQPENEVFLSVNITRLLASTVSTAMNNCVQCRRVAYYLCLPYVREMTRVLQKSLIDEQNVVWTDEIKPFTPRMHVHDFSMSEQSQSDISPHEDAEVVITLADGEEVENHPPVIDGDSSSDLFWV